MSFEDIDENDIQINEDEGSLAVGFKVPTSVQVPTSYLSTLRKYKDIYNDIYKQIEVSNKIYKYNSLVGNAVDVLIDFAVTDVKPNATGNKTLDNILQYWFENVNGHNTNTLPGIYNVAQEIALEWFTSGNAFPYTKWSNEVVNKQQFKLPTSITLINPKSIEIPSGPIAFGQEIIYLKYDSDLLSKIQKDGRSDPESALIKQAIPRSVLNSIQKKKFGFGGVRLNPKYITHIKRRSKSYQAWGIPYLSRCFAAVSILEKLRELDESISTGLLNLITIFKIGTEDHPATRDRLRKFANLIRNPKATTTLVWTHDVTVEQVGPDGKILAFKNKYEDAKQDVLTALGVPKTLMSMNQQGDAWTSILSLIERLTNWRKIISLWLVKIMKQIAQFNGFDDVSLSVKWDRMNLTKESEVKNLILAFYDRGLISTHTALQESGYDFDNELSNKKKEQNKIKYFLPPELPFSGKDNNPSNNQRPNDTNPKMTKNQIKKTQTKNETINLQPEKKVEPNVKAK